MPIYYPPVYSVYTRHWTDCAVYDTLNESDCHCWQRPKPERA